MLETRSIEPLLEARHIDLARELQAFCASDLEGLQSPEDDAAARNQARELLHLLGSTGWLAHAVPRDGDLDRRACCLIREALAASSPLADAVFALQCLGTQPLLLAGEGRAVQEWLDRARRGEAMTAFAMTEESAGSDVSAICTRASKSATGWRLDGAKRFISNAGIADLYLVLAVTDAERRPTGLSWFLVPGDNEGLVFAGPQVLSEPHPLGEIELRSCRLGPEALVGGENDGFKLGMATLDRLRPTVAAAACGMASRALDEATRHARDRQQFGRPLSTFQLVQQKLAVMATELEAARLLTYSAARAGDLGRPSTTGRSAMAKWFATETAQRVIDQAVQIHGGVGLLATSRVDRLYRAIRALRVYEGTTEIQQLVVARELMKQRDPGA